MTIDLHRWPSIVWQFLWSWVFAPVVLFRARKIHDTLGWRTQTIACCIAKYVCPFKTTCQHKVNSDRTDSLLFLYIQLASDPHVAHLALRPRHEGRQRLLASSRVVSVNLQYLGA